MHGNLQPTGLTLTYCSRTEDITQITSSQKQTHNKRQSINNMTTLPVRFALQVSRRRLPHTMFQATSAYTTSLPVRGEAFEKVKEVIQDYRVNNFQRELPSRFVKEFLSGVDKNGDGYVSKGEIVEFLDVIDAQEKVSNSELDEAMAEIMSGLGAEVDANEIPVDRLGEIMLSEIVSTN